MIDRENLDNCLEKFERVEEIEEIIVLGRDGGIRRIIFEVGA